MAAALPRPAFYGFEPGELPPAGEAPSAQSADTPCQKNASRKAVGSEAPAAANPSGNNGDRKPAAQTTAIVVMVNTMPPSGVRDTIVKAGAMKNAASGGTTTNAFLPDMKKAASGETTRMHSSRMRPVANIQTPCESPRVHQRDPGDSGQPQQQHRQHGELQQEQAAAIERERKQQR